MKRLLFALLAATLAATAAFAQPAPGSRAKDGQLVQTPLVKYVDDAAYIIQPSDRIISTRKAFTGTHTWILPPRASVKDGTIITVLDGGNALTTSNTLTIAPAGNDTISAAGSMPAIACSGCSVSFIAVLNAAVQPLGVPTNWAIYAPATVPALASGQSYVGSAAGATTAVTWTGNVTINNTGVTAIGAAQVTNAMLANMAANTFKGNNTGGSAAPTDISVSSATGMLNAYVGDSGSGGTKGLVPAPASGDAAANKYAYADGTWKNPTFSQLGGAAVGSQLPNPAAGTIGGVKSHDCGSQFLQTINTDGTTNCATPAGSVTGVNAVGNVTPGTVANTTSQTLLQAVNVGTGAFNSSGQDIRSTNSGYFSSTGVTPTLTLTAKMCPSAPSGTTFTGCKDLGVLVATITSATNNSYIANLWCGVKTAGASGVPVCRTYVTFADTNAVALAKNDIDANGTGGISGTFDLTGVTYIAWSATWSAASASNTVTSEWTVAGSLGYGGTITTVSGTSPIVSSGGTTPAISCPTCVAASSPGVGLAHFAGSTQTVTSSAVNLAGADVTGLLPIANGGRNSATSIGGAKNVSGTYRLCDSVTTNGGTSITTVNTSTTETVLYACKITANTLGANGSLWLRYKAIKGSATNTVTLRVRFGTGNNISGTQLRSIASAGASIDYWDVMNGVNLNATNSQAFSQTAQNGVPSFTGSNGALTAIDTTADTYLVITGQCNTSSGADSLTMQWAEVMIYGSAGN